MIMKNFDPPMVTISKEEYDQLQECKSLIEELWSRFGPYDFPKEFRLPPKKFLSDYHPQSDDFKFYSSWRYRLDRLFDWDDSE